MSESIPILRALVSDVELGRPAALCVVVKTQGSTPQPAGACMLVRNDMSTVGTLGGGCVEAEVRKRAFGLLVRGGKSEMADFLLDHDYGWDDGLICGGRMHFGISVLGNVEDIAPMRRALVDAEARRSATCPIRMDDQGKPVEYRLHLEVTPTLIIAGAGYVGRAVAGLAIDLGFRVVVVDDREDMASRMRFPERVELVVGDIARTLQQVEMDSGTYVVIVTRGHQHDHQALDAVVRRPAAYIGLIGSKRKARMIFGDLANAGVTPEQIARVHTPIGLPIGAVSVPEIAISIAAELVQVRRSSHPTRVDGPFEVGQNDVLSSEVTC